MYTRHRERWNIDSTDNHKLRNIFSKIKCSSKTSLRLARRAVNTLVLPVLPKFILFLSELIQIWFLNQLRFKFRHFWIWIDSDSNMMLFWINSWINSNFNQYRTGHTHRTGEEDTSHGWFVSNCKSQYSRRIEMVKELQKYIDVDIYGACGTKVCSYKNEEDCRQMAAKNYKFYLSLENSLCLDYVTEKYYSSGCSKKYFNNNILNKFLFDRFFGMMQHSIVLIVVGFHGHHEKIAPIHSFINAAHFENMRALADYLILLDRNDTLYNEYFWWKPYFKVRNGDNHAMCHLCASLRNKTFPNKIYTDMSNWWDKKSLCTMPKV